MEMYRRDFLKGLIAAAAATQVPGLDIAKAAKAIEPVIETVPTGWQRVSTQFEQDGQEFCFSMWVKGDIERLKVDVSNPDNPIICLSATEGDDVGVELYGMQLQYQPKTNYIKTTGGAHPVEHTPHNLLPHSEKKFSGVIFKGVSATHGDPFNT